jgi:hypothetical protein
VEQRESARHFLKSVYEITRKQEKALKWLERAPLELVPKGIRERWVRKAFSLIFRSAAVMLCVSGIYVSGKEETTAAFKRAYPNQRELCDMVSRALTFWENWKTRPLTDSEARQLLEDSLEFIKGLQSLKAKRLTE